MSDYELRNARDWDAASSARRSSLLSEEIDDGFTEVQASKTRRQNQKKVVPAPDLANHNVANVQNNAYASRHPQTNGYVNARGGSDRARGRGRGRGNGVNDYIRERPPNQVPTPTRASTQRQLPSSAAELASQRGEPATDSFSFAIPRRLCEQYLQAKSANFKTELLAISRRTATYIEESPADVYLVLIWGDHDKVRQAILQLEDLSRSVQPHRWAKNHAYDGRKENRLELKALEEEQATRLQLVADSQEYPYEYSFIWPDSELSLQHVIDTHEKPRGAFDSLRSTHQCSIRCDVASSTIIIQGMQERDVVAAGRKFEAIARQMIAEMAVFIKISLLGAPSTLLYQPYVSMDQIVDLKTNLYYPPIIHGPTKDTFVVSTPKLWTMQSPPTEEARTRSERMARRLERFNRKTILAGLERSLTNMHFVQKAVRMQVKFGELAFLRYLAPQSGSEHHSLEEFRKTMGKDRTDLLLQAMSPDVQMTKLIEHLRKHPALKDENETSAPVVETYVVAFDFRRPNSQEIIRHEQEFGTSYQNDEMELRRRSWTRIGDDSNRTSPMILSMLDFEKLDWQLRIQADDILDPKDMAKEYSTFEAGVGIGAASWPAGITGNPTQRATWPRGYHDLVRITNKPVMKFTLGRTDHVLEIAREDVYEADPFQSSPPKPQSKWTASFYYSKWTNDLGEFAYKRHGERPSWEQSLSTFFPEADEDDGQLRKKPKGPRDFLKEIEQVKDILWEAIRLCGVDGAENNATPSARMGMLPN